jgi:hypothetical protein
VANHDNAEREELADGPTPMSALDRSAFDASTAWMINEVGAHRRARSAHDALRASEGEVLQRWREGLGVVSKAELNELVCTAHVIRDALRPEQVGERRRLP